MRIRKRMIGLGVCLASCLLFGQAKIQVELDRQDARYSCGEDAVFKVTVLADAKKGELMKDGTFSYRLSNDGFDQVSAGRADLSAGNPFVVKGTLKKPGFLRLNVNQSKGKLHCIWGASYESEKVRPAAELPADFWSFWEQAAGLSQQGLPQVTLTALPKVRKGFKGYKVTVPTVLGPVYGFLTVPEGKGPYPVLMDVPGAGPGFGGPLTEPGFVSLVMNVHVYDPVQPGKTVRNLYDAVNKSRMYMYQGLPDREKAYFYRAIVGISKSVQWLAAQPYVDAKRIGYYGSSQGGAFGFILGGLNRQFAMIVCNVPAMCDHLGDKVGRSAGWPRFLRQRYSRPGIETACQYFDAMNFARRIEVPITVIVGLADSCCSPSSVYAAYNVIPSKNKRIIPEIGMGHACRPSYFQAISDMKRYLQEQK